MDDANASYKDEVKFLVFLSEHQNLPPLINIGCSNPLHQIFLPAKIVFGILNTVDFIIFDKKNDFLSLKKCSFNPLFLELLIFLILCSDFMHLRLF